MLDTFWTSDKNSKSLCYLPRLFPSPLSSVDGWFCQSGVWVSMRTGICAPCERQLLNLQISHTPHCMWKWHFPGRCKSNSNLQWWRIRIWSSYNIFSKISGFHKIYNTGKKKNQTNKEVQTILLRDKSSQKKVALSVPKCWS